jgi:hypothetical protein
MTIYDDGTGPALCAAGGFGHAGGVVANNIAKWNGSSWSPLGSGTSSGVFVSPAVNALAVFDDGSGPALYAGGYFTNAGGVVVNRIARWNGSSWSALGSGIGGTSPAVFALRVFDDGTGPALYVGGQFTTAGGLSVAGIAKWNGSSWFSISPWSYAEIQALTVFDDGGGPALYAGGSIYIPGGVALNNIAKWDGSSWSSVGGVVGVPVNALTVSDDGSGPGLFVGGEFTNVGGVAANSLAKWDGSSWSPLGDGISQGVSSSSTTVDALTSFDDGNGSALFVGGGFAVSPAGDSFLAKWGNPQDCGTPGSPICHPGIGGIITCPCSNDPPAFGPGCDNSAHTGGARLTATGIARLSYDTVVFTTHGEKPTATSIVLQGASSSSSGVVFGQGVRCVVGHLERLYTEHASGGSITAPHGNELHVHARSAALGDTIAPGTHRYYGVYYRDPTVPGGCPTASTFNITQQLDVLWGA